jgi:hypothetical protein
MPSPAEFGDDLPRAEMTAPGVIDDRIGELPRID